MFVRRTNTRAKAERLRAVWVRPVPFGFHQAAPGFRRCALLPEPCYWPLRLLFLTSSDRGRQYDHDRRDTRESNAHGSGVVNLFLYFDRRPSFLTQGDVSSRLLCENPVVRDKNFRLVTSLALVSTAQGRGDEWGLAVRQRHWI